MRKFVLFASIFLIFNFSAFAQTGGLKGKVRTSKGEGIADVTVTARQNDNDLKSAKTDNKGNFVLNGLKAGVYNLVFDGRGYSSSVLYNVEIKEKKVRDLPDRLILAVDQGTLVIVRGSVFTQSGHSIYGAKVEIEKILEDGKTRKVGSGFTSRSGEFIFRFPEGAAKFRVTVSSKGNEASKEVEVDTAAIYRLALILDLDKK